MIKNDSTFRMLFAYFRLADLIGNKKTLILLNNNLVEILVQLWNIPASR